MKVHIGQIIKSEVEKQDISIDELAKSMDYTRDAIHKIFRKETIDTGLLLRFCEVLDHDFFKHYRTTKGKGLPATKQDVKKLVDAVKELSKKIGWWLFILFRGWLRGNL